MIYNNSYTAKQYYDVEIGNSSSSTMDSMKIGLMYVSDYGFAASNSYWTTALYSYGSATSLNWLYLGDYEWTISPLSSDSRSVFNLNSNGNLSYDSADQDLGYYARPVFYLKSNVEYNGGTGTESDPFTLVV